MRDIKFRAWDNINKIMVYPRIIKESFSSISSGDLLNRYEILMQYTGLKDKNGTEIYEGDIVKIEKWSTLFKVVFDQFFSKFTVEKINIDLGRRMDYICDCEVIGNIYENPELL